MLKITKEKVSVISIAVFIVILLVGAQVYAAGGGADAGVAGADAAVADTGTAVVVDADTPAASTPDADAPAATPPARTREPRAPRVSLTDAVATAEKMYYCGELYLFTDSMMKINYEMAAIAVNMKDAVQGDSILRNRALINSMNKKYNAVCDIYNSWVDVKGDLEFFIDTVGSRNIFTKTQLQIVFSRTLASVNATRTMLEAAYGYIDEQSADMKRLLTGSADSLTMAAAGAVSAITPSAQASIVRYRAFFDQFAKQAGITLEYKTWSNPEESKPAAPDEGDQPAEGNQ